MFWRTRLERLCWRGKLPAPLLIERVKCKPRLKQNKKTDAILLSKLTGGGNLTVVRLSGDDMLLNGKPDQLGVGLEPKLIHDAVFVEGHGPRRYVQDRSNLFHGVSLC